MSSSDNGERSRQGGGIMPPSPPHGQEEILSFKERRQNEAKELVRAVRAVRKNRDQREQEKAAKNLSRRYRLFQRQKSYTKRILEIVNYIILPLQYITKDVFLLFSSYNTALNITVPALRFIGKNLSWLYGVSFILDGLCVLIEATRSENEDKRLFLISQGIFMVAGGIAVAIFAVTNPQIYLPLICVVWGVSTVLFLYDMARDYLKNKALVHAEKQALIQVHEQIMDEKAFLEIDKSGRDEFLKYISTKFHEVTDKLTLKAVDTSEIQAEIIEKIARIQDKNPYASLEDVDNIIKEMLDNDKYNPKVSKTTILTAVYISLSFICALATFIFFGNSDAQQTAIFSHILITTGMILKRVYDYVSNPIVFRAQFENISSHDMDQLSDKALEEKYLKKRLKRLGKTVVRLLDKESNPLINRDDLRSALTEYGKIIKEINKNSPFYQGVQEILSNCVRGQYNENDMKGLTEALLQSIRTRQVYLGSNHACLLSNAVTKLIRAQTASLNTVHAHSESFTGQRNNTPALLQENKITKALPKSDSIQLSRIAQECKEISSKGIPRTSRLASLNPNLTKPRSTTPSEEQNNNPLGNTDDLLNPNAFDTLKTKTPDLSNPSKRNDKPYKNK
jgi:hypothetical protein